MNIWKIATIAWIIVAIASGFGAYEIGHHAGFALGYRLGDKAGYNRGTSDANALNSRDQSFATNTQLQVCLDGVDKWYNANQANVRTIPQQTALDQEKQQNVQECQLRYPAN